MALTDFVFAAYDTNAELTTMAAADVSFAVETMHDIVSPQYLYHLGSFRGDERHG